MHGSNERQIVDNFGCVRKKFADARIDDADLKSDAAIRFGNYEAVLSDLRERGEKV